MAQAYIDILSSPEEIQAAVASGKLPVKRAAKYCELSRKEEKRQHLLERLRSGDDPARVFSDVFREDDAIKQHTDLLRRINCDWAELMRLLTGSGLSSRVPPEEMVKLSRTIARICDEQLPLIRAIERFRRGRLDIEALSGRGAETREARP
jgi:hypothetical protein